MPWPVRRVNQRYRAEIAARLADAGLGDLPQPGYWALMALDHGVHQAGQLATEMGVSKQAVSRLVDALVSADYVTRRPDQTDRRKTELVLSAKGRKAVNVITAGARATERTFVAKLGAESFAQLISMLQQLTREES
jgi:DNA-binding MarR family transcriptional regulator